MTRRRYPIGFAWLNPAGTDHRRKRLTVDLHLGCAYLGAYLDRERGIRSRQYVLREAAPEDLAEKVRRDGVRILGFSVKDTNFFAVRWAAAAVKRRSPSTLIVLGGLSATFSDELLLTHCPDADACLRGYAERELLAFSDAVLAGQDWRGTPALTYRDGSRIMRNPGQAYEGKADLDFLPSPYLSGILPGRLGPAVGISTSRGCLFHCSFCNPTVMAEYRIAYHSDQRVIDELRYIDDGLSRARVRGRKLMLLNEDIFALNPARTLRLCRQIEAQGLKHLLFGCETRIEHLDEEVLGGMYAAGFRMLKFGLESGNPRVLNTIKKVRSREGAADGYAMEKAFIERVTRVVAIAKQIGFRVVAGAIFGLPGERLADAIDTLDAIHRLAVDEYYHNYLHLFPGTELFREHERWGYRLELNPGFYPSIYRTYWPYPVELVPRLTTKLRRALRRDVVCL
ncbi:MAG: B12-binding domain-containing radical SAM protein [Zoogloeaceae bacterium]|nr:B12-binding domain-containing radical SAM protein [Zoogloeaceae bacterium]